jgi:membrane protein implicated in regulation of membrane protease activity
MIWLLLLSGLMGAICAAGLPTLIFALVAVAMIAMFFIAAIFSGFGVLPSLGWAFLMSTALSAGNMATHLAFYMMYVRRPADRRREAEIKLEPRSARESNNP